MPLAERLLEQARHLAGRDARGRPRQDHLRRAVSTAYYALFHFLIDQACRSAVGASPDPDSRALRGVLARAFDHTAMKKASTSFASGALPAKLQPGLRGASIPADLRTIADAFRTLQEWRHAADYDLLRRFERRQVVRLIDRSEEAMRLWPGVQNTQAGRLYLLALLAGERVRE